MGDRGKAAPPTALRVLRGDRRDRINDQEPQPAAGRVEPPAWLSSAAVGEWERLAPDLKRQGVLTAWDVEPFADYCSAVARVAEAERHLAEDGAVVEQPVFDRNGVETGHRLVRSPWALELRDALTVKGQRSARFGLTPSDRSGIKREGPSGRKGDDLLTG